MELIGSNFHTVYQTSPETDKQYQSKQVWAFIYLEIASSNWLIQPMTIHAHFRMVLEVQFKKDEATSSVVFVFRKYKAHYNVSCVNPGNFTNWGISRSHKAIHDPVILVTAQVAIRLSLLPIVSGDQIIIVTGHGQWRSEHHRHGHSQWRSDYHRHWP